MAAVLAPDSVTAEQQQSSMLETTANGDVNGASEEHAFDNGEFANGDEISIMKHKRKPPTKPDPPRTILPYPKPKDEVRIQPFPMPGDKGPFIGRPVPEYSIQPVPGNRLGSGGFTHGRYLGRAGRRSGSYKFVHQEYSEYELRTGRHVSALVEYISDASREAKFLKDSWTELITQREALFYEREDWCYQIDELSDLVCRLQDENKRYKIEILEKDEKIEKIHSDLTIVREELSSEQRKVHERERDIERMNRERITLIEEHSRRYKELERVKDDAVHKQTHLTTQIEEYKKTITRMHETITSVTASRNKLRQELADLRSEHEHHRHHHDPSFHDGYGDLDFENERLRVLLRDARSDRERAELLRIKADKERDDANSRFENRSRQWDRYGDAPYRRHPGDGLVHISGQEATKQIGNDAEVTAVNGAEAEGDDTVIHNGVAAEEAKGEEPIKAAEDVPVAASAEETHAVDNEVE